MMEVIYSLLLEWLMLDNKEIYSLMQEQWEVVWLSKEKECSVMQMAESTMILPLKSNSLFKKLMLITKKGRRDYMRNR